MKWRQEIGFDWEIGNQYFFDEHSIPHKSNSTDFTEWQKSVGHGVDHTVFCGKYRIGVESKKNNAPVYPSYIRRDHIRRFDNSDFDFRVELTNDKSQYSEVCIELLRIFSIMLMTQLEFLMFYCKLYYDQFKSIYNLDVNKILFCKLISSDINNDISNNYCNSTEFVDENFRSLGYVTKYSLKRSERIVWIKENGKIFIEKA